MNKSNKKSKYLCKKCNFNSNNKKDWSRHIETIKHKRGNKITDNKSHKFICDLCNKPYRFSSGLSRHKKKCGFKQLNQLDSTPDPTSSSSDLSELVGYCKKLAERVNVMNEKNKKIEDVCAAMVETQQINTKLIEKTQQTNAELMKELANNTPNVNQIINNNQKCYNNISINVF